jgi:hypothetical protein
MFPGKNMNALTPDQQFSVTKEDGLAARALNPTLQSFVFTNLGRGGVEPNVHITPDKKWVVFTGQFAQGQRHVYAVEIEARR